MRTHELIDLLATQAGPAPRALPARRLAPAIAGGLLVAVAAAWWFLGLVPAALLAEPALWVKLGYTGLLAAAASGWVARLGRPAAPAAPPARAAGAVVLLMVLLGLGALLAAPSGARVAALLGRSWSSCPFNVLMLALPTLAAALWALRGLAPTQPRRAGFAAGVLAGAVGAFGYAFSCGETSLAFVALWYSAGIAAAGALGALLGPRALRW